MDRKKILDVLKAFIRFTDPTEEFSEAELKSLVDDAYTIIRQLEEE